jgi:regulator of RNase E activity RraA
MTPCHDRLTEELTVSSTNNLLERLARFDTPTICNAIELFGVRSQAQGFMNGLIRAAYPGLPPMVGYASTASFRSSAPGQGGDAYASLEDQLHQMKSLPGPAIVVFQDMDDPPVGATFGEVMCSIYQAFGAIGLVTSGGGRDLNQVRELKFPVFTGATICSHAYSQTVDVGRPVRVGGLLVQPGDLLHGDANGVTNIPLEIATEVADSAAEFVAAERLVLEYAQGPGEKTIAELMDRRRAMDAAVAALRQRLTR